MKYKYVSKLVNNLAYFVYLKMYRISDKPFEKSQAYISISNNEWNKYTLSSLQRHNVAKQSEERLFVSDKINEWNKFVLEQPTPEKSQEDNRKKQAHKT